MLSVARLKRVRTGAFKARKALPEDIIREAYAQVYGQKWEAIFWAPAGTPPDRVKLLHAEWLVEVERRLMALRGEVLSRSGGGPHRAFPEQAPATLVASRPNAPATLNGVPTAAPPTTSASALFEAYGEDMQPAASTINRWRAVFTTLDRVENWQAPGWDAQAWLDGLNSAARTVCGWAVRKKRLGSDPFEGRTVEVPKTVETRETGRAFTEAEALSILRTAAAVTSVPIGKRGWQWSACRRWAPWMMAYTGARSGEITQLRACDVEERSGVGVVVKITPEAGTVKTGKVRVVPIHGDIASDVLA